VLFHDASLDCRTDGRGPVSGATLSQLKALDAGYGYSPDGGKTFPLRAKGRGLIPTLEEALAALPQTPLLYNVQSNDPAFGDRLIAALKAEGRDPVAMHDGFSAPAPALARIRATWPRAWSYSDEELGACTNAYLVQGWLGLTPAACRDGTIIVPLNREWLYAGWPDRLIARMEAVRGRIIVIAPSGDHKPMGLDRPEQVGRIPVNFNGYVWVDDMWSVGPALRPADDRSNPREGRAAEGAGESAGEATREPRLRSRYGSTSQPQRSFPTLLCSGVNRIRDALTDRPEDIAAVQTDTHSANGSTTTRIIDLGPPGHVTVRQGALGSRRETFCPRALTSASC
jgi:glycerophosphoryl diester phosphodiesterase